MVSLLPGEGLIEQPALWRQSLLLAAAFQTGDSKGGDGGSDADNHAPVGRRPFFRRRLGFSLQPGQRQRGASVEPCGRRATSTGVSPTKHLPKTHPDRHGALKKFTSRPAPITTDATSSRPVIPFRKEKGKGVR